jgi:hypothetical protein
MIEICIFAEFFLFPVRIERTSADIDDLTRQVPDRVDQTVGKSVVIHLKSLKRRVGNPLRPPDVEFVSAFFVAKHGFVRQNHAAALFYGLLLGLEALKNQGCVQFLPGEHGFVVHTGKFLQFFDGFIAGAAEIGLDEAVNVAALAAGVVKPERRVGTDGKRRRFFVFEGRKTPPFVSALFQLDKLGDKLDDIDAADQFFQLRTSSPPVF